MAENQFDRFEKWLYHADRAPLTVRAYLATLHHFKAWFEQSSGTALTPVVVTVLDIRDYREHLQAVKRLAPATINRHLAALRTYMRWAKAAGLVEHSPLEGIKSLPSDQTGIKWLGRAEQSRLMNTAKREIQLGDLRAHGDKTAPGAIWPRRDHALLVLLLNTGLRLGETAALTLDDIEIRSRSGKVIVRRGKGRKYREVPLNLSARRALNDWLDVRPEHDALFLSQKGGALSARAIRHRVGVLGRKAGIVPLTAHMLRHTFAKNLVDAGVSLEKVAALLGHSSIATTQIYITPAQSDLAAAAERIAWEE